MTGIERRSSNDSDVAKPGAYGGRARMSITTRLTQLLRLEHPILLAPMDLVAGGRLAAAVSRAGGSESSAAATATKPGSHASWTRLQTPALAWASSPGVWRNNRGCSTLLSNVALPRSCSHSAKSLPMRPRSDGRARRSSVTFKHSSKRKTPSGVALMFSSRKGRRPAATASRAAHFH